MKAIPGQATLSLEKTCKYYETCSAPLCPFAPNLKYLCWYPDEEICKLRRGFPDWVRKQRKIAKLPNIDPDKYFTVEMLEALSRVSKGLQGADPDKHDDDKKWLAKYAKTDRRPSKKHALRRGFGQKILV